MFLDISDWYDSLAKAYAPSNLSFSFKSRPEDFMVSEQLCFDPDGEGEHYFLLIDKTGANTEWVARQLARIADCSVRDIGYAGLKDRHGICRQWFSMYLPGKPLPSLDSLPSDIKVVSITQHKKKLKHAGLKHNEFSVVLRGMKNDSLNELERRWDTIRENGVPNYYGYQRFGREGGTITKALRWKNAKTRPRSRQESSMVLSSARSYLFNRSLSTRVDRGDWLIPHQSDLIIFDGSGSCYAYQGDSDTLDRLRLGQVHIASDGRSLSSDSLEGSCRDDEDAVSVCLEQLLVKQRVASTNRPLRVIPKSCQLTFKNDEVQLRFQLPPGSYATAVLRELGQINDQSTELSTLNQ
jgi:tRNA pseudouridine13 synthase